MATDMDSSQKKKKKSKDYNYAEEVAIAEFYAKHRSVLDAELSGSSGSSRSVTVNKKMKLYEELTKQINSIGNAQREVTSVKTKLRDLKSLARQKRNDNEKGTGGGKRLTLSVGEEIIIESDQKVKSTLLHGLSGGYEAGVGKSCSPPGSKREKKAAATLSVRPRESDSECENISGDLVSMVSNINEEDASTCAGNILNMSTDTELLADEVGEDRQRSVTDNTSTTLSSPVFHNSPTRKRLRSLTTSTDSNPGDVSSSKSLRKQKFPRNAPARHGIESASSLKNAAQTEEELEEVRQRKAKSVASSNITPFPEDLNIAHVQYFTAAKAKLDRQKSHFNRIEEYYSKKESALEKQKELIDKEKQLLQQKINFWKARTEHETAQLNNAKELHKLNSTKLKLEIRLLTDSVVGRKRTHPVSEVMSSDTQKTEESNSEEENGDSSMEVCVHEASGQTAHELMSKIDSKLAKEKASSYTQEESTQSHVQYAKSLIVENKWADNKLIRTAYRYFYRVQDFLKVPLKNLKAKFEEYADYVERSKQSDEYFLQIKNQLGYTSEDTAAFGEYILRIHKRMLKGKTLDKAGKRVVCCLHFMIALTYEDFQKDDLA